MGDSISGPARRLSGGSVAPSFEFEGGDSSDDKNSGDFWNWALAISALSPPSVCYLHDSATSESFAM